MVWLKVSCHIGQETPVKYSSKSSAAISSHCASLSVPKIYAGGAHARLPIRVQLA